MINLFWIIVAALNFILFYAVFRVLFQDRITAMLDARRARIEQGLADAEAARLDRESRPPMRPTAIAQARREAKEIIDRAQKVAEDTREADIAATREELERLRTRPPPRSRPRSSAPWRICAPRSPTWPWPRPATSSARR